MKLVHTTGAPRKPDAKPLFNGQVERIDVVGEESKFFRLSEVSFKNGARTKLHVHTTDQILLVSAGEGTIATEHESHDVVPGDVALIPAGERHWHGARPGKNMSHWSVQGIGETTIAE